MTDYRDRLIKNPSAEILLYVALLLSVVLLGCKYSTKEKPPIEGQAKIIAVRTEPDSSKVIDVHLRVITKSMVYDIVKKDSVLVYTEVWGKPIPNPVIDSLAKKQKVDSLGRPLFHNEPIYIQTNGDSINTNVQNIPIDSLLSKHYPVKN